MGLGRDAHSAVLFPVIDFETLEMGTFHGAILIDCCNFTLSGEWDCSGVGVRELRGLVVAGDVQLLSFA